LNGSDWRLAISDWQIVGVAISHDEKAARRKRQQMAISDWQNGSEWRIASSEWRMVKRQRCWSGYQPRRKKQHDRKPTTTEKQPRQE
jgi:hypothetical protein